MGIIPPDPGAVVVPDPSRAILLAKSTTHDRLSGGFRRGAEVRWLRRDGARLVSSSTHELRVSAETHAVLAGGRDPIEGGTFASDGGDNPRGLYVLVEDGFEARAERA